VELSGTNGIEPATAAWCLTKLQKPSCTACTASIALQLGLSTFVQLQAAGHRPRQHITLLSGTLLIDCLIVCCCCFHTAQDAAVAHCWELPPSTFGGAYAQFMGARGFKADDRPTVRQVQAEAVLNASPSVGHCC